MTIDKIINTFKSYYPDLNIVKIFKSSDGFVIFAPTVKNGTDYNDPYYFIDNDLSIATKFNMRNFKKLTTIINTKPIWVSR